MTRIEIHVGSVVMAIRQTGVCDLGELGVCYEVYRIGNRPGYSFIFEGGRFDGFSPEEVASMLQVTGDVCPSVSTYRFQNVMRLCEHFQQGRFDAVFQRPYRGPTETS